MWSVCRMAGQTRRQKPLMNFASSSISKKKKKKKHILEFNFEQPKRIEFENVGAHACCYYVICRGERSPSLNGMEPIFCFNIWTNNSISAANAQIEGTVNSISIYSCTSSRKNVSFLLHFHYIKRNVFTFISIVVVRIQKKNVINAMKSKMNASRFQFRFCHPWEWRGWMRAECWQKSSEGET